MNESFNKLNNQIIFKIKSGIKVVMRIVVVDKYLGMNKLHLHTQKYRHKSNG